MPVPISERLSCTVDVGAPAERVWALVSDLPGMGAFSLENRDGRRVGGSSGPALGAVFVGRNGAGARRWSTHSTVEECEQGSAFGFTGRAGGLPVARWS